jgi:hypothetical protein
VCPPPCPEPPAGVACRLGTLTFRTGRRTYGCCVAIAPQATRLAFGGKMRDRLRRQGRIGHVAGQLTERRECKREPPGGIHAVAGPGAIGADCHMSNRQTLAPASRSSAYQVRGISRDSRLL